MGRVLVLSSLRAATGNAITAARLAESIRAGGHECLCRDSNGFADAGARHTLHQTSTTSLPRASSAGPHWSHHHALACPTVLLTRGLRPTALTPRPAGELSAFVAADAVSLVVGIHAYRSGRLLVGSAVPYVLVLGGTDMNVMMADEHRRPVMLAAAGGAGAVVAFSRELLAPLTEALPSVAPRCTLVPQAIRACVPPRPPLARSDDSGAAASAAEGGGVGGAAEASLALEEACFVFALLPTPSLHSPALPSTTFPSTPFSSPEDECPTNDSSALHGTHWHCNSFHGHCIGHSSALHTTLIGTA